MFYHGSRCATASNLAVDRLLDLTYSVNVTVIPGLELSEESDIRLNRIAYPQTAEIKMPPLPEDDEDGKREEEDENDPKVQVFGTVADVMKRIYQFYGDRYTGLFFNGIDADGVVKLD